MLLFIDGSRTFILFSYGDINWGAGSIAGIISRWRPGYNHRDIDFFLPLSGTDAMLDIETTSNVGFPGLYIYRIDQDKVIEPNNRPMRKY